MSPAGWIAFAVFSGFAAMMLHVGVREWHLQRRLLASAKPVVGRVVSAVVTKHTSSDTDRSLTRNTSTTSYTPEVRFRYDVAGRTFESDRLGASVIVRGYASRDAAEREIAGLAPGAPVQVLVDARHPELGFLRAGSTAGPVVFIAVGLGIPPLVWWVGHYI